MIKFWAGVTACLVGLCAGYGLASRNSSGTMAGINGPYTAGTVISSSTINARFSDIETEITDSASRSGKGGFTSPIRGADGVVTAPTFAFTSETGTGLYRIGSSDLGVAINQVKKLELTSSLFTVTPASTFTGNATFGGVALGANGAVGAPSYSFTNDATAGLYRGGSGDLRMAIGGADKTLWSATGFGIGGSANVPLEVVLSGSGTTTAANFLEASLADASSVFIAVGKSTGANTNGYLTYTKNATAANSTLCLGINGASNALCADGNNNTIVAGSLKVGTGSAIAGFSHGSCALNGGTPATCTATVVSSTTCVANVQTTVAANTRSLGTSLSSTTLTITSQTNGDTLTVNYVCF